MSAAQISSSCSPILNSTIVDPKNFDPNSFVEVEGNHCIIPAELVCTGEHSRVFPHSSQRADSVCRKKSTYARCGIIVNVTPFEPEWEGHVTLEFSNTTPLPAKIYANEGIAQVLFSSLMRYARLRTRIGQEVSRPDRRDAAEGLTTKPPEGGLYH